MVQLTAKYRLGIALLLIVVVASVGIGWWWFTSLTTHAPDDGSPMGDDTVLKSGFLVDIDLFHQGSGEVQLIQTSQGIQSIKFLDVMITSGPDLYVYLSKKSSFSGTSDSAGEYVDLGLLPAIQGNFSIDLPLSVNGSEYASVLIWCQAFAVPFTYAPLS